MARSEINIFGTSFLDLLSGALAAVIILFVIVPKMSAEDQAALEQIDELNVEIEELADLMERLEHSVPDDLFQEIMDQMNQLRQTVEQLTQEVQQLTNQLAQTRAENEQLRQRVQQLENVEQQNQELQQRIEQLEQELNRRPQQSGQGISDGKVFGINAEVGVAVLWPENVDVDLYVVDRASGVTCYFRDMNHPFGNLLEDIRSRTDANTDRYELFYQEQIVPGTYEIYVQIYSSSSGTASSSAHVEGYAVMHPGKSNQQKIPLPSKTLTQVNTRYDIGVLTVTENSISLN